MSECSVTQRSVAQRIEALLDHLALERVHVAACMSADWGGFVAASRHRVATLAVVAPHLNRGVPAGTDDFPAPAMVIAGAKGAPAERARALAGLFPDAELVELSGYSSPIWADTAADRLQEVKAALLGLWSRADAGAAGSLAAVAPSAREGEHAGLRYRIQGVGPPVLLLPLSLAPSQWQPLVDALGDRFCFVSLGGAHLGAVALLEARAASGYGELVTANASAARLERARRLLEVGCGSGALTRRVLARAAPAGQIVATDVNPYLLAEAKALADAQALAGRIQFEAADATRLPFADDAFDASMSCTVLEEGDAERMLAELARVTRPGGRVIAIVRALDVDWWINVDLEEELRRTLQADGPKTGSGVSAGGCADASLYSRARRHGIRPLRMGPQLAPYRDGERLDDVLARLGSLLRGIDREAFDGGVARARAEGSLLVCEPFHCLVGEVE